MPSISRYMTRQVFTIDRSASFEEAHRMMTDHSIRHLPVLEGGYVVGVLSERRLQMAEQLFRPETDVVVGDIMTKHPFSVTSDVPLDEVAEIMAEKKYGSAIVIGRDGVEGIFTVVDACRVLANVLEKLDL